MDVKSSVMLVWLTAYVLLLKTSTARDNSDFENRLKVLEEKLQKEHNDNKILRQKLKEHEDKFDELQGQLQNGRSKRQEISNDVAFFATISKDTQALGHSQIVVFDHVITMVDTTNSPNTYSQSTGVFTAPLNGLYVFSTTMTGQQGVDGHFQIFKNNTPLTIMLVHGSADNTWDGEAQTVVLLLKRGETVTIRNRETGHTLTGEYDGAHSLFTGFLLREHSSESMVIG